MEEIYSSKDPMSHMMRICSQKRIPAVAQFEITYSCNLKCQHCNFIRKEEENLTTGEIKDIIDQLKEMGTFYLAFTGGEIFTRPDFFEIAWHAKKQGFILIFMTNATLITPEKMEEIKRIRPRDFEISLLGATPETHDKITGVKGSWEKAVWAIKELTDAGIEVITKTALMKMNVHEYKDIARLSRSLGAIPSISPAITPRKDGNPGPQRLEATYEDLETFTREDSSAPTYFFRWEDEGNRSRICNAGKSSCCIAPNGDLSPCVVMPIKFGNLREKSFKELWENPEDENIERLRSMVLEDLPKCRDCDLTRFCHRCAGVAYLETGDFTMNSPIACRLAKYKLDSLGEDWQPER